MESRAETQNQTPQNWDAGVPDVSCLLCPNTHSFRRPLIWPSMSSQLCLTPAPSQWSLYHTHPWLSFLNKVDLTFVACLSLVRGWSCNC